MENLALIFGAISVLIIYFIPSILAAQKKKKNSFAIFLVNLLLGWTLLGWIVALVWAATKD